MRIVSLLPSATEVVCALGLAEQVVGVSPGCDWPADLERKPALVPVVPVEAWAHDEHVSQGAMYKVGR